MIQKPKKATPLKLNLKKNIVKYLYYTQKNRILSKYGFGTFWFSKRGTQKNNFVKALIVESFFKNNSIVVLVWSYEWSNPI